MSEMWNSVADAWERNAEFVDGHLGAATEQLLDLAELTSGDEVLEVAAGPGGVGMAAVRRVGDRGRVVLSDVAPAMVEAAARRAAAAGLANVEARVSDQAGIEAPDATFDAVVSRHGLMFADAPAEAAREAARVLKPGGRYAAMTWDAREANPWLGLLLDAVGAQFGVPFPPPHIPGPFALGDPDDLAEALTAGGLAEVATIRVATPMVAASLDEWWERVPQLAGPLAMALAGMEADVRDQIHDRALASAGAHARDTDDGIELDGSVLIGTGRRG